LAGKTIFFLKKKRIVAEENSAAPLKKFPAKDPASGAGGGVSS
jgi:hypothetical protein